MKEALMGREIRRVPKDFDFPLNETWTGFLHPDGLRGDPCSDCFTKGTTPAYEWVMGIGLLLEDVVHDLGDQRRERPAHPYLHEMPHHPYDIGEYDRDTKTWVRPGQEMLRPSEDLLPLMTKLCEISEDRLTSPMAGYTYRVGMKLIEAAGLDPMEWGKCPTCGGHGDIEKYKGQRAEYEAWEPTDPPEGDGWQLWQTVSEGGPISPVFATQEELARWMSSPAYTWGANRHGQPSYENALEFISVGWAPTGATSPSHGVEDGVTFIGRTAQGDSE
jgi:hypothetical protein